MEDERGFGERVQCCLEKMFSQLKCLLTAKLCEEFLVLAGHLDLYGKELFCYRRKKEQKKDFAFGSLQFVDMIVFSQATILY